MDYSRLHCCPRAIVTWRLVSLTFLLGCGPANHAPEARAPESHATVAAPAASDEAPAASDEAPAASDEAPAVSDRALLWVLHAAEYRAVANTVFAAAAGLLAELLTDKTWTAALEQNAEAAEGKPAAVIVDVDDTLLGSGAYQWQIASQGQSFEQASWDAWTRSAEARAVPGAVEYIKHATALKVAVFYVTNRSCQVRPGSASEACPQASETRARLIQAGFPPAEPGHLLLRGMRPEWRADKSSRRAHVASKYRVLQLIGDDLGDFVATAPKADNEQRNRLALEHRAFWGRGWFMLPNPMYGSWQAHLPAP